MDTVRGYLHLGQEEEKGRLDLSNLRTVSEVMIAHRFTSSLEPGEREKIPCHDHDLSTLSRSCVYAFIFKHLVCIGPGFVSDWVSIWSENPVREVEFPGVWTFRHLKTKTVVLKGTLTEPLQKSRLRSLRIGKKRGKKTERQMGERTYKFTLSDGLWGSSNLLIFILL